MLPDLSPLAGLVGKKRVLCRFCTVMNVTGGQYPGSRSRQAALRRGSSWDRHCGNWPSETPSRYMRMRSGFMPRFCDMKSSISSRIAFCSSVISSVPTLSLRTSCSRMRAAKRVADLLRDPTTAATDGAEDPGAGWVTSAPKIMYGRSVIQPSALFGFCSNVCASLLITLLTPPSLALSLRHKLWQYWSRRFGKNPMPAFFATTHCDGMPRLTSLWYLVSLYSGDGLLGITTRIIWHGNPFRDDDACPHLPATSIMACSMPILPWYMTVEGVLQNMPHPLAVFTR
mmetsp:Transcript_35552/g.59916  ORF Transcript_35552/g.59916 Transcript_35552/m.59916 type:complete len:285 (+) Transcript_35552:412-1266(+)